MAKIVAELQKEAKEKLEQAKKLNEPSDQTKIEEQAGRIAFLEAQTRLLQEQSLKRSSEEEEKRLEQEAKELKKQEEALRQEADVARILNEALAKEPKADEASEQLDQKEVIGLIAETVGKALDASSKLTMSELEKRLGESNKQIAGMQKVLIDLLSGLSVKQAQQEFPDFDKFSEDTRKIHAEHPSLSPKDAYLLAKAKKEASVPESKTTETEKPNEPPAWSPDTPFSVSRERETSDKDAGTQEDSRQRFRRGLSNAIDDIIARGKK